MMVLDSTPNPSCLCGCGEEVSRPTHKWVAGHYGKKLSPENKIIAVKLLRKGVSQYEIARRVGVSQTTICFLNWELKGRHQWLAEYKRKSKFRPAEILRKEDLEEWEKYQKEKKSWQTGKRTLREIKTWLRQNAPCR